MLTDRIPTDRTGRAVSPVIGVILMVAITVILAAVIGVFVMDMGQDAAESTPQASFSFDWDSADTEVTVTHTGGDAFNSGNTVSLNLTETGDGDGVEVWELPVSAGQQETINTTSGSTVRVVWESDSGKTQVLAAFDVP